jgi:hypothetical protein
MCNIETIDAELRLLWRAWRVAREMGCAPNTAFIDALLDERASRLAIPDRGCRSATKASGSITDADMARGDINDLRAFAR